MKTSFPNSAIRFMYRYVVVNAMNYATIVMV